MKKKVVLLLNCLIGVILSTGCSTKNKQNSEIFIINEFNTFGFGISLSDPEEVKEVLPPNYKFFNDKEKNTIKINL